MLSCSHTTGQGASISIQMSIPLFGFASLDHVLTSEPEFIIRLP